MTGVDRELIPFIAMTQKSRGLATLCHVIVWKLETGSHDMSTLIHFWDTKQAVQRLIPP